MRDFWISMLWSHPSPILDSTTSVPVGYFTPVMVRSPIHTLIASLES